MTSGSPPPAAPSELSCPACGVGVDPLRAGEVAVFAGKFFYFCSRSCKAEYLLALSNTGLGAETVTFVPPVATATLQEEVTDGVDDDSDEPESEPSPSGPRTAHVAAPSTLWLRVIPCIGAVTAAAWAAAVRDPHLWEWVGYAGVTVAFGALLHWTLRRVHTAVQVEGARILNHLDVSVNVVRDDVCTVMTVHQVKAGEHVLVEGGQVAGVDGEVIAGEATVIPWLDATERVIKRTGDALVAGATVVDGQLRLVTTWSGRERAWARALVKGYLPLVTPPKFIRMVSLVAVWLPPIAAIFAAFRAALTRNEPTAAIIAIMTASAIAAGSGGLIDAVWFITIRSRQAALARGVVYKDDDSFDRIARVDRAVVCTRGAVVAGDPHIVAMHPVAGLDEGRLFALAAGAQIAATRLFPAVILRAAQARGIRPEDLRNVSAYDDPGVTATLPGGEQLVMGGRGFLLNKKVSIAIVDALVSNLEGEGHNVFLLALDDRVVGVLALQDQVREGVAEGAARLQKERVEVILLGTEARATCEALGRVIGVDHVRPEIPSNERDAEVRALGEAGHVVGVIGLPSLDGEALTAAYGSIAMSAAGASPGEWAVALASNDLRDAVFSIILARSARLKTFGAAVVGIATALTLTPMIAVGWVYPIVAPIVVWGGWALGLTVLRRAFP